MFINYKKCNLKLCKKTKIKKRLIDILIEGGSGLCKGQDYAKHGILNE